MNRKLDFNGDNMCLAIPGKVLKIDGKIADVDFDGVRREVRLDLLEKVQEGDYVIVHVGYAIQVLDQEEARRMIKSWSEIMEVSASA